MHATGTFKVNLQPLDSYATSDTGNTLARMSIDKQFQGDLEAHSIGEMLSAMTATEGSAGYVAIEQVTGTLDGKHGSFVLQHFGIMNNNTNRLILEVVPNSGTGQLAQLQGSMSISIQDGQHSYSFDYSLGE